MFSIKLHHQATEVAYDINKKNIQMDIVDSNIKNFQVLDNSLSTMPLHTSDNEILKHHIIEVLNDKISQKQSAVRDCQAMKEDDERVIKSAQDHYRKRRNR